MIRDRIGFQGLLMTDDIAMQALSGPVAERTEKSLAAGCDLVLHCNGDLPEMEAVATAAGTLNIAAATRADAALARRVAPAPVDIAALEAEFETLLAGEVHV
jgi:beta-N-acetylhexosaminidase